MLLTRYLGLAISVLTLCGVVSASQSNPDLDAMKLALEGDIELFERKRAVSGATLTIPSTIAHSMDIVTIQISGVTKAASSDILALYSPANVDPTKTTPIGIMRAYQFEGSTSSYTNTGKATAKMQVLNMHSDIAFILYRNGSDFKPRSTGKGSLVFVVKSNTANFAKPNEPNQGHLSLTGKAGEMKVQWVSGYSATGQTVKVGTTSGTYTTKVTATSKTYTVDEMCEKPASGWGWKSPGLFFSAVVTSLKAGTKYYYVYGSDAGGWSAETYFLGPSSSATRTVNFIALADLGFTGARSSWLKNPTEETTVERIISQSPKNDFVLMGGDLAYAFGYLFYWDYYFDSLAPSATKIPWMTAIGNHEMGWAKSFYPGGDSRGECGIPYERRTGMPAAAGKPWYSFNYGPVHVVVISTEHNFNTDSEQIKWLKKDLASVNRKTYPWIVVNGHKPLFSIGADGGFKRRRIGKVLDQYKVSVYLAGHIHNYQRFCPITYEGKCKSGAPVHVTVGMAGYTTADYSGSDWKNQIKKNIGEGHSGYSQLSVSTTTFKLSYIQSSDGKVLDSFTIKKASAKRATNATEEDDPSLGEPIPDDGADQFDAPVLPTETQEVPETEEADTLITDDDMETGDDETLGEDHEEYSVEADDTAQSKGSLLLGSSVLLAILLALAF